MKTLWMFGSWEGMLCLRDPLMTWTYVDRSSNDMNKKSEVGHRPTSLAYLVSCLFSRHLG